MANPSTHFFKFVPPGFLYNVSIPESFLKNLTGKRCSIVILRRGRHNWSVDIDDGVFSEGWRRFVSENGVQEFDFIVFKHQGSMVFDFMVFDQSTCEKQYPNLSYEMKIEEPVAESDPIGTRSKLGPKKQKKRKWNDYASEVEDKIQVGDGDCFMSKMTPYVINKSRLHVPMKFVRSNGWITERIWTPVHLMDDTRRIWPATLKKNKTEICLTGWHEFGVKNHLKVGDHCMFNLVKHGDMPVFKCHNMGKTFVKNDFQVKERTSILKEAKCKQKGSILGEEDGRPYFVGKLNAFGIRRSIMYLPNKFVRSNGLNTSKTITLKNGKDERSWTVELKNYKNKFFYIGRNWDNFRVSNGLKEGDRFKFELVEKGENPIVCFYLQKKH